MSALATDDFNRADGGLGGNWTTTNSMSAPAISTNRVRTAGVGNDSSARYTAISWPDDQYSQVVVPTCTSANAACSAAARIASAALTFYRASAIGPLGASAVLKVAKFIAGASTTITSATKTINANDVVRIEVVGTSVSAYVNGVLQSGPTTDSSIASGDAGVFIYVDSGTTADAELDDWEAGSPAPAVVAGLAVDYSYFPKQPLAERAQGVS